MDFVRRSAKTKIFVGLHRHDVITLGCLHLLLRISLANPISYANPAIADTLPVQNEIVAE
jgi:hypothetical protein